MIIVPFLFNLVISCPLIFQLCFLTLQNLFLKPHARPPPMFLSPPRLALIQPIMPLWPFSQSFEV
jgi:hypothetical protein